eukprot:465148_1
MSSANQANPPPIDTSDYDFLCAYICPAIGVIISTVLIISGIVLMYDYVNIGGLIGGIILLLFGVFGLFGSFCICNIISKRGRITVKDIFKKDGIDIINKQVKT